jgi:hypothetical protein
VSSSKARKKGEAMGRATKFLAAAVAIAGAALVMGVVSAGAESGPACADITGENHNYATRGTVSVGLILAGASDAVTSEPCKSVTYTLVISGITGSPLVISQKGNNLFANVSFSDTDDNICISATTSAGGRKVHDAAPDQGCLEISVGSSGGNVGFG